MYFLSPGSVPCAQITAGGNVGLSCSCLVSFMLFCKLVVVRSGRFAASWYRNCLMKIDNNSDDEGDDVMAEDWKA